MKNCTFLLDQGETMGGAERFLVDFCNDLSAPDLRRLNLKIIGAKTSQYKELLKADVPVIPFAYPNLKVSKGLRPFLFVSLIKSAFQLKKLIKKEGAKTLYTNTPKTHLIVWNFMNFLGGGEGLKWYGMIHDFTTPGWLLKSMGEHCDIIAVNSVGTREDTRSKMKLEHFKKIRIIENGISIPDLPPAKVSLDVKKVLIIGRIDRRKGQNYALEAAKIIEKKYPEIHFSVVGAPFDEDPKTGEFYEELKGYVKKEGLKNVTFVGEVKNSFEAYLNTDLVLFTPIDPEPFGRVTIEALAMGKAVLTFNETGPREVIQQLSSFCSRKRTDINLQVAERLLVKSCDSEALANAIEHFIVHTDHMKAIASFGRAFVESQYPLEETKKRILQMLEGN